MSPELASALREARQALRVSEASLREIEAELGRLEGSEPQDAEAIEEYSSYRERAERVVEEQREVVDRLEAQARQEAARAEADAQRRAAAAQQTPAPAAPTNRREQLDREFEGSLGEFDAELARRAEELAAAGRPMTEGEEAGGESLAAAMEAARRRLEEREGTGEASEGSEGEAEQEATELAEVGTGRGDEQDEESTGLREGSQEEAPTDGQVVLGPRDQGQTRRGPGGRSSQDDDDVVARQIREAAEQEQDPVLRERLWAEYERYKASRSR